MIVTKTAHRPLLTTPSSRPTTPFGSPVRPHFCFVKSSRSIAREGRANLAVGERDSFRIRNLSRLEPKHRLNLHGADSRKDDNSSVACGRWPLERNSMFCPSRNRRNMAGHRCRVLEWLEPRCLLTSLPASIISVSPSNGQQLTQSPQEIDIVFNPQYAPPYGYGFDLGGFEVQIERLNADGSTTPIFNPSTAPDDYQDFMNPNELDAPMQLFNPTTFAFQNITLPPGQYEVVLVGGSGIATDASGVNGPGAQLWDPSQDYAISTFTVLGPGPTFSGAQPLVPNVPVLGSLSPNNPTSAVDFYTFTLPQGFWQVGIAVSTNTIGSTLKSALALFEGPGGTVPEGTVLASRDSGTGLSNDPNDPYIFSGLSGGTYYIGVSGAGYLPGGSTGYNPILGTSGTPSFLQPGGQFELEMSALPHNQPTRLVDFTVNRADITNPSPTTLTLTFSAPIDISNLFNPGFPETALEVVDSSGQVWPTTSLSYDISNAQLTLVIDQPLPAGNYSLIVPSQGGLTDLAGEPIVASGEPAGVLATFAVAPPSGASDPNNLGILWPGTAQPVAPPATSASAVTTDLASGQQTGAFNVSTSLAPGQSQTYRWVVIVPGFYQLQTQGGSGHLAIVNFGNGQTTVLDSDSTGPLTFYLRNLNTGVYGLRFINVGPQTAQVNWQLRIASLSWEQILANGLGQISALSLGSLAPTPSATGMNSFSSFHGIAENSATDVLAGSSGPIPTNLLVTLNTGLIGQPSLQNQSVAPVGPTVEAGSMAFAGNTTGLPPGIRYGSQLSSGEAAGNDNQPGATALADSGSVPDEKALRLASAGADSR